MNQLLLYLLAITARRHGMELHALCAMSTHLHLVVTDVRGELPTFLRCFHRLVALCTKVLRGWQGPLWDKEPTSVVRLVTHAAVVEKIAYVLANPVSAGLVSRAHEWPGAKVLASEIGKGEIRARRPDVYLDPANPAWTEEATLSISLPPCIEEERAAAFRRQVEDEIQQLEAHARAEAHRQGRGFLGVERVEQVPPEVRATSVEPRFDRNPTFAVGRGQADAWRLAIAAVRTFRASYRAALERWRAGVRSAVYPAGTWWMRIFHGAVVQPA